MLSRPVAVEIAIALLILVQHSAIGLPFRLIFERIAGRKLSVPTAVYGFAAVIILSWYWYKPFGPTRNLVVVLTIAGSIAFLITRWRDKSSIRQWIHELIPRNSATIIVAIGLCVVYSVNFAGLRAIDNLTTVSINNDVASYTYLGQHLRDHALNQPGNIEGFDAGHRLQSSFDFGPFAAVASSSSIVRMPVYKYMQSIMLAFVILSALCCAQLISLLTKTRGILIGFATILGFSVYLFSYLWSCYFLNQVLAIGLVASMCIVLFNAASGDKSTKSVLKLAPAFGFVFAAAAAAYAHMAVLGTAVIGLPIVIAASNQSFLRRVRSSAILAIAGLGAAFLVMPTTFWRIPSELHELGTVVAGWPLPSFTPGDIFGFTATETRRHTVLQWYVSLIFSALALALLFVRKKTRTYGVFVTSLALIIGTTYYFAYHSHGASYRQWKWLTFFVPIIVASVVTGLFGFLVDRFEESINVYLVCGGIFAGYLSVVVTNSSAVLYPIARPPAYAHITPEMLSVTAAVRNYGITDLNIDVSPYWDTMWVAYLAEPVHVHLVSLSYYPVTSNSAQWTLTTRTGVLAPGSHVEWWNKTYELAKTPSG